MLATPGRGRQSILPAKLIITYYVGLRGPYDALAFMDDLSGRAFDIGTITTDGYAAYPDAVRQTFGRDANYAQLIKVYRAERPDHARYSPAACIGTQHRHVSGFPHADTSRPIPWSAAT